MPAPRLLRAGLVLATTATTVATTVAAVLVAGTTAASAAVEPTRVEPTTLARGADPSVPHVEGTTLVDGAFRVAIDAERVDLLGRSGSDYLVSAVDSSGRGPVLRVTPAGAITTVVTPSRNGDLVSLSTDGSLLAQAQVRGGFRASRITVWDSTDGSVVARRTFPGISSVLDLDRRRVVVGNTADTRVWRPASNRVKVLVPRGGYRADLAADRLAVLTGDPYDGGCTVVSRISAPRKQLWRSCSERVEDFAPGGSRMATVDLLSDGIGPGQVLVRSAVGVDKGVYRVRGYFGMLTWESPRTLLLETYGRDQGALVRCTGTSCERAGELVSTPDYSVVAPAGSAGRSRLPAAWRAPVTTARP